MEVVENCDGIFENEPNGKFDMEKCFKNETVLDSERLEYEVKE